MFEGVYTALVTPFRDGAVDERTLHDLVEQQVAAGVDGLVPCGSTGEAATLSHAEHRRVIEVVVAAARGRVRVLAGAFLFRSEGYRRIRDLYKDTRRRVRLTWLPEWGWERGSTAPIGGPIRTRTSPGYFRKELRGQTRPALCATGTTGACA